LEWQGILQLSWKEDKIGSYRPQRAYNFVETVDNINSKAHKADLRKGYKHLMKIKPGCQKQMSCRVNYQLII